MSQVLRRLTVGSGSRPCSRNISTKYQVYPLVTPVNETGQFPVKITFQKNLLQGQNYEARRSMSILTDLLKRKKKYDEDDETIPEVSKSLPMLEEEPKQLTEEELAKKRDISRLRGYHRRLVHGMMPHTEPQAWFHHTVRYKQRMYGIYGEASGVNPGLLWFTKEELKDRLEFENVMNPFTIQEMVEKKRMQRQMEKEAIERRAREVEEKMAMIDKYKEDLERRQREKEMEKNKAQARREKLVEEVRRHFGYTVDPKDDRFQELLAKKEKEDKKKQKEARKLERQARLLERLQGGSKSAKEIQPLSSKKNAKPEDAEDS